MRRAGRVAAALVIGWATSAMAAPAVLVEAESFAERGGWVIDQQVMDQMGSPFLLAHGLGTPVADAVTKTRIASAGRYRVWVRTRNWIATWQPSGAPGQFQLIVNGKPLAATFGAGSAEWQWHDGGTIDLPTGLVSLALHDLTGFDGRCDAIVLSQEPATPPNRDPEMWAFRKRLLGFGKPREAGEFDLVVVGGGLAGTCAAISAARYGLSVALVQDRPVLGGNNSSEVRVGASGKINLPPYPALGNLVREIAPIGHYDFIEAKRHPELPASKRILALDPSRAEHNAGPAVNYEDDKKLAVAQAEKTLKLYFNQHVTGVEKQGERIAAVVARNIETGEETRFAGMLFADCTGDGNLGFLAGADFRMGRESQDETAESRAVAKADQQVMGTSVQWYATKQAEPVAFPDCPWALAFTEETCQPMTKGDWDWENGMNRDQVADFERVRDHGLRVVYGNWSFLKNHAKQREKYANYRLDWVAYIGGKRESRRLMGDVVLKQQDVVDAVAFPDASVTTTWTIDLHFPNPKNSQQFPGEEFRSIAVHTKIAPYPIPYRTLYSRNVANLFMAGRNISVTHVALGTIRVQKTGGMMGEVVGMAASICKQRGATPREVYQKYLAELKSLMQAGIGRPAKAE